MLAPKKELTRDKILSGFPFQLHQYNQAFEPYENNANDLPPHRPAIHTAIEIEKDSQGREKNLPKYLLYGMSRDDF